MHAHLLDLRMVDRELRQSAAILPELRREGVKVNGQLEFEFDWGVADLDGFPVNVGDVLYCLNHGPFTVERMEGALLYEGNFARQAGLCHRERKDMTEGEMLAKHYEREGYWE